MTKVKKIRNESKEERLARHAVKQWFNIVLAQIKHEESTNLKKLPRAFNGNTREN